MTDDIHRAKWYATMRKKLAVDTDEEVSAWFKEHAARSSRNTGGTGGFAKLSPEERREVSLRGVRARGRIPKTEQETN